MSERYEAIWHDVSTAIGNSHMGAGWTAYGCGPLSSLDLVQGGKRPVWVMRPRRPARASGSSAPAQACPHDSLTGTSSFDINHPDKVWRCDECDAEGTVAQLRPQPAPVQGGKA